MIIMDIGVGSYIQILLTNSTNSNKSIVTIRSISNQQYFDSFYVTGENEIVHGKDLILHNIDKMDVSNINL